MSGDCLVSGSDDLTLRVWDVKKVFAGMNATASSSLEVASHEKAIEACVRDAAVLQVGMKRLFCWYSGMIFTAMSSCALLTQGHSGAVSCVAISPDGQWVASGSSEDRTVRVWQRPIPLAPSKSPSEAPADGEHMLKTAPIAQDQRRVLNTKSNAARGAMSGGQQEGPIQPQSEAPVSTTAKVDAKAVDAADGDSDGMRWLADLADERMWLRRGLARLR